MFTISAIAIQTGDTDRAWIKTREALKLAPEEPAIWANLGLLQLRTNDTDAATTSLNKAISLLPPDASPQTRAAIEALLALVAGKKDDWAGAAGHLTKALALEPENLLNRYALYDMQDKIPDPVGALATLKIIVQKHPDNLEVWLQITRIAAKLNEGATFRNAVGVLTKMSKNWQPLQLVQLKGLQKGTANPASVAVYATFLRNTLKQEAQWRFSYGMLTPPLDQHDNPVLGVPLERFAKLPNAPDSPAPSDMTVTFTPAAVSGAPSLGSSHSTATWIGALWLSNIGSASDLVAPFPIYVDGVTVHIAAPAYKNDNEAAALTLPGDPRRNTRPLSPHSLLALDFDYDLLSDIFIACDDGLKLCLQTPDHHFKDATAQMKLPPAILKGSYRGAWGLDYDADGDLDILVAREKGSPLILRNNGDGSFKALPLFSEVSDLRQFAWADIDGDGAPDAALLDAQGNLHVYMNHRSGQFVSRAMPADLGKIAAIAAADMNHDGKLDFILLRMDGSVVRLSDKMDGTQWDVAPLAIWKNAPSDLRPDTASLFIADLDNNGALDIVASSSTVAQAWMNDGMTLAPLPSSIPAGIRAVADIGNTGRMDLLGIDAQGQPLLLQNKGTKNYFWQDIRPRANEAGEMTESHNRKNVPASQLSKRSNSFGVGGEMEIRAGLLYQKQIINGPSVHFGLGEYPTLDVARILWPNGDARGEFEIKGDAIIRAEHRLNVSCPFLFTWNGDKMEFVTDCIWRSPLGLKINAQDTAGIQMTEDWVKIRGDQLVPRPLLQTQPFALLTPPPLGISGGSSAVDDLSPLTSAANTAAPNADAEDAEMVYDVRITAELWETHFFDHLSLMAVDHPVETAIFCDERFAVPPPPLKVYAMSLPQPVTRAWDDEGREVTELVRSRDGRHVANFGKGEYPGVTRDHWVELEFGDEVPGQASKDSLNGPLYLIAHGWIWPTNSNINVALSQGEQTQPTGLSIETPDALGCWSTRKKDLGFPEGKVKTIVLRIDDVFQPNAPRRLRLRTNLEIYWESLQWAIGLEEKTKEEKTREEKTREEKTREEKTKQETSGKDSLDIKLDSLDMETSQYKAEMHTFRLPARTAELRYRGFSEIRAKDTTSPELPVSYEHIARTGQKWRDLIGYYTRHGDILELLEGVDDRYVIMNAGDEIRLTFSVPPPPPPGWTRDFVLIGDGWVKDGNYNTTFSKTVLPLPSHAICDYVTPPGALEEDPVYQQHAADWQTYHTRYVVPNAYQHSIRPYAARSSQSTVLPAVDHVLSAADLALPEACQLISI